MYRGRVVSHFVAGIGFLYEHACADTSTFPSMGAG